MIMEVDVRTDQTSPIGSLPGRNFGLLLNLSNGLTETTTNLAVDLKSKLIAIFT